MMFEKVLLKAWLLLVGTAFGVLGACATQAAARDVQFVSVDFNTAVVELRNLGASVEALDGWRFCTHNASQAFRYSDPAGLNGYTLSPGDSLFLHFNNDADPGNPDQVNISALGSATDFATLQREAYALAIYFPPVAFPDGNQIADYLQWSIDGLSNSSADARSLVAEEGGVWVSKSDWLATSQASGRIELLDLGNNALHSSADYSVEELPAVVAVPVLPMPFALFAAVSLLFVGGRAVPWRSSR